ncbi:MAG: glycosyltransferase family 2 protein [Candidatus Doudnabacteria bacterium]|nr:glycosyltransferase family 2 protein [Candidatus Doudnabacteria bacterium]
MKLSIIVPAHNEEKTLGVIVKELLGLKVFGWQFEIIIVDDGSKDGTWTAAENFFGNGVVGIKKETNQGKGAAILEALKSVSGDFVLIQDADGEYLPKDIPSLLLALGENKNCAVFGDRGSKSYPERGFHYVLAAKFLTWVFNALFKTRLHDLYTGYKLMPSSVLKSSKLSSAGFEFEAEVAARLCEQKLFIKEVPIGFKPRSKEQGKHIRFIDAFRGIKKMVDIKFNK